MEDYGENNNLSTSSCSTSVFLNDVVNSTHTKRFIVITQGIISTLELVPKRHVAMSVQIGFDFKEQIGIIYYNIIWDFLW